MSKGTCENKKFSRKNVLNKILPLNIFYDNIYCELNDFHAFTIIFYTIR